MTCKLFEQVVTRIREDAAAGLLPGFLETAPILPTMTIKDLGIDSLGRVSLLTTLVDLTDLYVGDEAITDRQTLGEIVALATATTETGP